MIKEYLEERKEILTDIIRNNKEKYEHNQIAINESKNKIKELDETIDEAEKIFSVKAREDNGFKNQEISDIEKRIAAYMIENQDYKKNMDDADIELSIVVKCLDDLKNIMCNDKKLAITNIKMDNSNQNINDVSRETYETNIDNSEHRDFQLEFGSSFEHIINEEKTKEIISKLEFCKSIAEIDGKRVSIELDNIINYIR